MNGLLFDIEANGLLQKTSEIPEATTAWCTVTHDLYTGVVQSYPPDSIGESIDSLRAAECLVGHNIIGYDLKLLWRLYGEWDTHPLILDTLVVSRALNPERKGGHSLAAWGERLGFPKGDFHEFDKYSPEMLTYCERDVELNVAVLRELGKEMESQYGTTLQGYKVYT